MTILVGRFFNDFYARLDGFEVQKKYSMNYILTAVVRSALSK